MACTSGVCHTITLADNGVVHSFGLNSKGELGLGQNKSLYCNSNSKSSTNNADFLWWIFRILC